MDEKTDSLEGRIVYDENEAVKAGSLPALVGHLTRHDRLDAAFNRTFFMLYTYFTTTAELLDLLIARFDQSPAQPLVRFRVINVLKQWLENFWPDAAAAAAADEAALLLKVQSFAQRAMAVIDTNATQQVLGLIQRRRAGFVVPRKISRPSISATPPKPILPRKLKLDKPQFIKMDPLELARQLTILEAHMFNKLQPDNFLHKNFQKKNEPNNQIRPLIRYSNQLSNWVGSLILAEPDLKKRAGVIGHLVNVATSLYELQNYSSVVSILSGLESAPIYRLVRTWAMVTERACNSLRPLQALISSTQNYQTYRDKLQSTVPPCIPFLGVFLKDITFIEDGNPALTPDNLINFQKYTLLAATLHDIQRLKETPYCLQPVPELQDYLAGQLQCAVDLHDLWDRSCELERQGRGDENRPRGVYTPTGGMTASMVVACMILDD
ncbi:hypothetical protein ASPZODRAFT_124995 [Penicilliopsis zonata CBS 506.65]|uniref:Ras-GEF domain-containing protein n=1 Tax=Penicilliopsis zonata CBS 506.65 TaxID=1073090 RepID=A0A1L9S659_9EURO|nr:hypothetical protein ASPZODRAFT_124995 [Penicilliopsis zonata CBS 506.65]OJJ42664.1 hypothetical protein ASPZODRAFT_124995 [Penicilliopsis zonata CBS 506.65]